MKTGSSAGSAPLSVFICVDLRFLLISKDTVVLTRIEHFRRDDAVAPAC
jgi:hypothetical protein